MAKALYDQIESEVEPHLVGNRQPTAALLAGFLNAVWRQDLPEVDDAICDGTGDKGIDGIVVDDDLNEIAIFQSKHRSKHDAGQGDKELRNLVGAAPYFESQQTIDGLLASNPNAELANLIRRLDLRERVANGATVTRLIFVTNGTLDPAGKGYVASITTAAPELEIWDQPRLGPIASRTRAPELRKDSVKLHACSAPTTMRMGSSELAVAIVPAAEIAALPGISDLSLFDPNVRLSKGRTRVNRDLAETIKDRADHVLFPAYHNGLTLLTYGLRTRGKTLSLDGITVVNGCQSLLTFSESRAADLRDLNVLVKVVQVEPNTRLTEKITFRSNNQNPVDIRDQRSTDNIQRALQAEVAERYGETFAYEIREGEKLQASQVLTNQEAAQLLMAVYLREPFNAVRKVHLFDTDYRRIFNRNVDGARLYFLKQVSDVLKEARANLRSDLKSSFASVRFTLAYLLAVQLERTTQGETLLEDPQQWLPSKTTEVRAALRDLLDEIAQSVNFFIQEAEQEKGEGFDPQITCNNRNCVREVEHAVDRDIRRILKRPGASAFLFNVEP